VSAGTGEIKRVWLKIEERLNQDVLAYTDAVAANAQAELGGAPSPGRASPDMINALAVWRADVDVAFGKLDGTSPEARGRALALKTVEALSLALVQLSDGLTQADLDAAVASIEASQATLASYQRFANRLARLLR